MTAQEQSIFFEKTIKEIESILISKSGDYSSSLDKLSNFKLAGAIIGTTPHLNCLSLIATKVARLGVLLNTKDSPNNESIQDSVKDLANYALLLLMIIEDEKSVEKPLTVKYCRKCDECESGMNVGYLVDDLYYYCSDECLNKNFNKTEYDKLYKQNNAYWTEWDLDSDADYELINGVLTEIE